MQQTENTTPPPANVPRWGVRGGLTLSLYPCAVARDQTSRGGRRGLFRVGLPRRTDDAEPRLLNFVAVEPITADGRRGLSELEKSPADGASGLNFWCDETMLTEEGALRLTIRMERFTNGTHPYVIAELSPARPHEVRFEVYAEEDSAPMTQCILTATMGNFQRLRRLHLKGRVVHVDEALPESFNRWGFTDHAFFPLDDFRHDPDGGVRVEADGDEAHAPGTAPETPPNWRYDGDNFVQYWRQPAPVDADLRAVVNARRTYWASDDPIPGGKSYENFELNASYRPGQVFVFGIQRQARPD